MAFVEVQNKLYNGLTQGLGQNRDSFQLIQPAWPLIDQVDLWLVFNSLPPKSGTYNLVLSPGNQYFSNYSLTMGALRPAVVINVREDIGEDNYIAWMAYLRSFNPIPPINQWPDIFLGWAYINAPEVANIGASDYAAMLLEPITAAQIALSPYRTIGSVPGKEPDWLYGLDDLKRRLMAAPAVSFTINSETTSSDISDTWTGGASYGFFGLWGGSLESSYISQKFSMSSRFNLDIRFEHVLAIPATPGPWYNSGSWGFAYDNQGDPPWREGAVKWENAFGPDGNMQRYIVNALVVDGYHVTVTASAGFSQQEQQTIINAQAEGFWPFYADAKATVASKDFHFDDNGNITIETHSVAGTPLVIGCNVFGVDRYTGHQRAAQERLAKLARV
jgi:hypothetical protein